MSLTLLALYFYNVIEGDINIFVPMCLRVITEPMPLSIGSTGGRAVAQAVSRWLPTMTARVQSQVGSCGISSFY
jgi:hypothetical protein